MVPMRVGAGRSHHSQPEAAVPLEHQNRLGGPLSMGLKKRHAELLGHFQPLGALTEPTQQGVHLGERHERGPLGIRDQDQAVQPLHLLEQLLNRGEQSGEGKHQETQSLIFSSRSRTRHLFVASDT